MSSKLMHDIRILQRKNKTPVGNQPNPEVSRKSKGLIDTSFLCGGNQRSYEFLLCSLLFSSIKCANLLL